VLRKKSGVGAANQVQNLRLALYWAPFADTPSSPDISVFLLGTRAGGLGINLTATYIL